MTNFLPTVSLAVSFFTAIARNTMRGLRHLGPVIEERLKHSNECGNEWAENPVYLFFFPTYGAHCCLYQNDLLSWLIEESEGPQLMAEALTKRVLVVNFTAIHVSLVVIWSHPALTGNLCQPTSNVRLNQYGNPNST